MFDEETPHDLIAAVQPDVLVKGADWAEDGIVGRDIVEARGGIVVRVPVEPGHSTSCDHREDSTEPAKIGGRASTVTTSTSLNLRAVLKTAVARGGLDVTARVVSGLTSSANALFVAAAAHARPKGAVLYVVPTDGDLEQVVGDTRFFLAALEGLSDAAAQQAVLPFPSHEVDPYRGMCLTSASPPSVLGRCTDWQADRRGSWWRRRRPSFRASARRRVC